MKKKGKPGRPKVPESKRFKTIMVTISPPAYRRFYEIPAGERSRRVSKFLERCDPSLILRDPGERLE